MKFLVGGLQDGDQMRTEFQEKYFLVSFARENEVLRLYNQDENKLFFYGDKHNACALARLVASLFTLGFELKKDDEDDYQIYVFHRIGKERKDGPEASQKIVNGIEKS